MKKRLSIISLLLITSLSLQAQDFKEAITRMQEEYAKLTSFHIVMRVQVFEDSKASKAFIDQIADIKRDGNSYRSNFGVNDLLQNKRYLIVVDRESREIICKERDDKTDEVIVDPVKMNLDSLLRVFTNPEYVGRKQNIDQYKVVLEDGDISRMDVSIHVTENVLMKLVYHYREGQYVIIDFQKFDKQPSFDEGTFDERNYITVLNGKLTAGDDFKNFNLSIPEN